MKSEETLPIQKNNEKISVWIVDDNKNFCIVLAANLNKSASVECQQYYLSCKEAIRELEVSISPPSVILLDIKMPVLNGLDAINPVRELSPGTYIIMLTSYDLDENIRTAMKRGASGYLLKSSSPEDIIRAIESVLKGGYPLDPLITKKMMVSFVGWEDNENKYHLSPRERDVIRLIINRGLNNEEIAKELFISRYTVETHLKNIFHKLGINNRQKLMAKALKDRLV
jgi:DNA-binding NarL/FixJ family response regulator